MIMEYTDDKYRHMLLTVGACNSQLVLLHGNTRYVVLVGVTQTLLCFGDWSSVSVRQEV
jgi:hypothetical protein